MTHYTQPPLLDYVPTNTAPSAVGSGVRDRRDFYPTPFGLVRAALDLIPNIPSTILDPCAGTGVWGEVAREKWPTANIAGVDLNFPDKHPAYDTWKHADFLTLPTLSTEDLIMMNPPYGKKAYHFIKIGLDHLAPNGYLVALVLLGFLAAQSRAEFIFQTNKPEVVYVLPRRPSFRGASGGSGTDTYNYMIGVWRKSNNSSDVALRMLDWNYDQRDKRKR